MHIHLKKHLNASENTLKEFGFLMSAVIPLLFGLLIPYIKHGSPSHTLTPYFIGLMFSIVSLGATQVLRPLYIVWMVVGEFIGAINSRIILAFVFYAFITPYALLLRLLGKDLLHLRFTSEEKSYRMLDVHVSKMDKPF